MKKKGFKTMAVSAVAGCLLLSLSVTTFANTGSGYASLKGAIESTMLTENKTITTQFEVKDDGVIILSRNSIKKVDGDNKSSENSITVDGMTKAFQTSEGNGILIKEADGKYYSVNKSDKKFENLTASSSTVKLAEMLADTLVGDVKNQFVKDGETISVKLEGAQIPELTRLAFSAMTEKNSTRMEDKNNGNQVSDESMKLMMDKMPKLSNVNIKSIAMTATVDGNTLKDNEFAVAITGNDANGATHELTVMVNAKITDVGNTKADAIDTTGKEVTTIDRADQRRNR